MKGILEIAVSCGLAVSSLLVLNEYLRPRTLPLREEAVIREEPEALSLKQIHSPTARMQVRETRHVVVAVIDTGCDVHHPDLSTKIWVNPGESGIDSDGNPRGSNGLDDDANGFVDDVHGWNFAASDSDVSDEHGHGTHISGIITNAVGDGDSPPVDLMILKYFAHERDGSQNLLNTIAAIRYAVKMGADIINYSGGGILRSGEEEVALRWAAEQGVLVVAAAGNEGLNSDFFHFYPADYDLPNIISVGAVDREEHLLPISNFGVETVDLAAPGKNIYSTLPNGQHGYMTGTSQATAFVTGTAALLIAQEPRLRDPRALIQHLLTHVAPRRAMHGKLRSAGLLDTALALKDLGEGGDGVEVSAVRRQSSLSAED